MLEELSFAKFLFKKKRKSPIYLIFEPTNRCNSACSFCYNKKQLNRDDEELSLEEIDKITKSMKGPLINLSLSGGEPFLRDDLEKIIDIFDQNVGMRFLTIPTNGLASEKIEQKIIEIADIFSGRITVMLSIDGIGKNHDEIRGVSGNFNKILETYERLAGLHLENLKLGVNTCLTDKNKNGYREINDFVKREMPLIENHNFSMLREADFDQGVKPPGSEFLRSNKRNLQKIATSGSDRGLKDRFLQAIRARYYDIFEKNIKKKKRKWDCYAGSLAGYLNYKGDLFPCEMLPAWGNLKDFDYDLVQLWNSKQALERKKEIKRKKCNCSHGCFVKLSTTFNLKEHPFLIKYVIR